MKRILLLCVLLLWGSCSRSERNSAPQIIRALTDLTMKRGGSIALNFKMIEVFDRDADPMTLIIEPGANYTFNGMVVTADADFLGEILVKVYVHDGKARSEPFYVAVQVIDYVTVLPLRTGNHWVYNDWNSTAGSTGQTKFVVDEPVANNQFDGVSYRCHWDNIDTIKLSLLLGDKVGGGNYLLGAESPHDTLTKQALRFKYPVTPGESWKYPALIYSLSDSQYVSKEIELTCADTAVYISVPAGVFKCIEYTSDVDVMISTQWRSTSDGDYLLYAEGIRMRATHSRYLLKNRLVYWYSPGIGCVAIAYFIDNVLIEKKELVSYNVF